MNQTQACIDYVRTLKPGDTFKYRDMFPWLNQNKCFIKKPRLRDIMKQTLVKQGYINRIENLASLEDAFIRTEKPIDRSEGELGRFGILSLKIFEFLLEKDIDERFYNEDVYAYIQYDCKLGDQFTKEDIRLRIGAFGSKKHMYIRKPKMTTQQRFEEGTNCIWVRTGKKLPEEFKGLI